LFDQLSSFGQDFQELTEIDETLDKQLKEVESIRFKLEEVYSILRDKFGRLDFDPERLKWIEERLLEIKSLRRKYGVDLLQILSNTRLKISDLEKGEASLEDINREIDKHQSAYDTKAQKLSKQRKIEGEKLAKGITRSLGELGLKDSLFEVRIEEAPAGPTGRDRISFYISTNMGQSPGLLQEIASGGELSRIMLALKTLLSKKDFVPILIFDEIDVNLGGQTAHKVAQKLKEVSKNHQIIVVTHLAQIAAYADHHYCFEKVEGNKKVETRVRYLPHVDRPREIARMLGSDRTSKVALTHAQELLNVGQK
jgi:DNA repair protein RecN (Recombination protein N)